jgi:hypothetical protein
VENNRVEIEKRFEKIEADIFQIKRNSTAAIENLIDPTQPMNVTKLSSELATSQPQTPIAAKKIRLRIANPESKIGQFIQERNNEIDRPVSQNSIFDVGEQIPHTPL